MASKPLSEVPEGEWFLRTYRDGSFELCKRGTDWRGNRVWFETFHGGTDWTFADELVEV